MDPTRQRCLTPLKAALDGLVQLVATYLVPTVSTLAFMFALQCCGAPLTVVVLYGTVYYWAVHFEAVTAYFHSIALPRAIDFSLDPSAWQYVTVALNRVFVALVLPTLVLMRPFRASPATIAVVGSLSIWLVTVTREIVRGEVHGYPCLQAGSLGNRLKPLRFMRWRHTTSDRLTDCGIPWGGLHLPMAELLTNFLVIGAVGTGKTLIVKAFLTAIFPLVVRYPKSRALVVDPKCELAPTIQALVPRYKVKMLNPGDARTSAWAVAKDLRYEKHFHEAAHIIIPSLEESQPFFTDGARAILQGSMMALAAQAPETWWFSDVFLAIRSLKRLETLLRLHPHTRDIYDAFVPNPRVWLDLYSTLRSKVADFYPVAAVWSHLQHEFPLRTISLTDFVEGNSILLLSMQASAGTSQGRLLALLIKRLSQLLLDQPTGQSTRDFAEARRTVIVIDEAPRAGKLNLLDLVTNGRDYGIGLFAAMQSVDAMLEHYPQDRWNALANEFHSIALLSTNSPTSLKWMSERLGNTDSRLPHSDKPWPASAAGDWTPVLDPAQFHTLRQGKIIGPHCVPGIYLNSQLGAWYSAEGVTIAQPLASVPAHVPIPDHWQELRAWDDSDLARLNLSHLRDALDLPGDTGEPAAKPAPPTLPRTRPPQSTRSQYPRFRP